MSSYIVIGFCLLLFELGYLLIAKKLGIKDIPHHQSSHHGAVIRGGGLLFYIAYLYWFFISYMPYPLVFIGLSVVAVTSFVDDVHSISPKFRLFLQFAGIIFMLYETQVLNLPFAALFFLSVACVGSINIYNFMDGINGLTGGYSFVVLLSLIYINQFVVTFVDINLLIYLIMAVLIFLFFNFRKRAICFAGDVGSMSMGFILVFLITELISKAGHLYWMALLDVYIVDGGLTILHRILLNENILKPHKKHAYQIMVNELRIPHLAVSCLYMALQGICCVWFIAYPGNLTLISQFLILGFMYLSFMKRYYHLHVK